MRAPSGFSRAPKPPLPAAVMLPANQLLREAVSVTVGSDGACVTATRGRMGKVLLGCTCAAAAADGWCRHEVALVCGRSDDVASDQAALSAFDQIVSGTRVQAVGRELDRAKTAFDHCLQVFDERRPHEVSGRNLGKFADLITDLAACAGELEDAAGSFRRLLAHT